MAAKTAAKTESSTGKTANKFAALPVGVLFRAAPFDKAAWA